MSDRPLEHEPSRWADFNSIDAERRFRASLRFAESAVRPQPGEWVRLRDDEGNSVRGIVDAVEGMVVRVRPEMTTWVFTSVVMTNPFVGSVAFGFEERPTRGRPVGVTGPLQVG